jgi:hypothetical protein
MVWFQQTEKLVVFCCLNRSLFDDANDIRWSVYIVLYWVWHLPRGSQKTTQDLRQDKSSAVQVSKTCSRSSECNSFLFGPTAPQLTRASLFTRVLDHTQRRTTVGRILWTSDQLVAKTSSWQHTTDRHTCPPPLVGFEPKISAGERPQTYALDRAATGTGNECNSTVEYKDFQ